jgi:hypothetical protein
VLASIRSAAVLGIAAYDVTVEVDVAAGLPAWTIVGLASSAVKEARERVSAALNNSGFTLPSRRVTVNLSPDNHAKEQTNADRRDAAKHGADERVVSCSSEVAKFGRAVPGEPGSTSDAQGGWSSAF